MQHYRYVCIGLALLFVFINCLHSVGAKAASFTISRSSKRPMGNGWNEEGIRVFNRLFNAVEEDRHERGQLFIHHLCTMHFANGEIVAKPNNKLAVPRIKAMTNLKRKLHATSAGLESLQSKYEAELR